MEKRREGRNRWGKEEEEEKGSWEGNSEATHWLLLETNLAVCSGHHLVITHKQYMPGLVRGPQDSSAASVRQRITVPILKACLRFSGHSQMHLQSPALLGRPSSCTASSPPFGVQIETPAPSGPDSRTEEGLTLLKLRNVNRPEFVFLRLNKVHTVSPEYPCKC